MFRGAKTFTAAKNIVTPVPRSLCFQLNICRTAATLPPNERPQRRVSKYLINQGAIPLNDAIDVLRAYSVGRENTSFELQVKYDRKKFNRELVGSCVLPTPMSQDSKILVFAEGKEAEEAIAAGAYVVGGVELIDKVVANEIEFNQVICTPAMFPHVLKIARTLGPRGLMPTPKKGNVTSDVAGGIAKVKGLFNYHSNKHGWVNLAIAKVSHSDEEVKNNIMTLLYSVFEVGAPVVKKGFYQKIILKTTKGPAIALLDAYGMVLDKYNRTKLFGE